MKKKKNSKDLHREIIPYAEIRKKTTSAVHIFKVPLPYKQNRLYVRTFTKVGCKKGTRVYHADMFLHIRRIFELFNGSTKKER